MATGAGKEVHTSGGVTVDERLTGNCNTCTLKAHDAIIVDAARLGCLQAIPNINLISSITPPFLCLYQEHCPLPNKYEM